MPVLFSLSHPLDEIAPVLCRTGGMQAFLAWNLLKIKFVKICTSICIQFALLDILVTYLSDSFEIIYGFTFFCWCFGVLAVVYPVSMYVSAL